MRLSRPSFCLAIWFLRSVSWPICLSRVSRRACISRVWPSMISATSGSDLARSIISGSKRISGFARTDAMAQSASERVPVITISNAPAPNSGSSAG